MANSKEWLLNGPSLQLLEMIPDQVIFFMTLERVVLSWNRAVEQTFGYSKEEFIGLSADALFTPEDRLAGAPQREAETATVEGWAKDERWHLRRNGTRFWAMGSLSPVLNQLGETCGYVKHLRDATVQRQQGEELVASEMRFRLIVETANEAVVLLDGAGTVTFCNSQFAEMVNEPHKHIIGKSFCQYIVEGEQDVIKRCFSSPLSCGRERHELCLRKEGDKDRCWVQASLSPLGADGSEGVLCFLSDISEARNAAQELQLSEARFRALVENSSGAISLMTREGEILYSSPALTRSLGFQPEELKQIGKFKLLHPDDYDYMTENFARLAAAPGHSIIGEYRLRRADGSYSWREAVATNMIDDPAVGAIVVNSRDITDRKQAEQNVQEALALLSLEKKRAEQCSLEKTAYISSMSHEIRTPLNAIIGYAELLLDEAQDMPEQFHRDLQRIKDAGRHLLELVNSILDLSKIESGHIELGLEEFELGPVIASVSETARSLVRQHDNILHVDLPQDVIMYSDRLKLRQILLNLLSNSCKFTLHGDITVRATVENQGSKEVVCIRVSDTGKGMSAHQLAALFEPYHSDEYGDVLQKGTGLGLVLTRNFCRLLGGELTCESSLGKGTTFAVVLPRQLTVPSHADENVIG